MIITGTSSSERLVGSDLADIFDPAGGNDTIEGGGGFDTLAFSGAYYQALSANSISADLATGVASIYIVYNPKLGLTVQTIKFTSVENLTGSQTNDMLLGNGVANVLVGGNGHDRLDGRGGNDRLFGGDGDDWLTGGLGNDLITGGLGIDTALFDTAAVSYIVDLTANRAWSGSGNDTLASIEHVTTGAGNDWVKGSTVANLLILGDGDDVGYAVGTSGDEIRGGLGNDRLYGSAGNDRLHGEEGVDRIAGGAGDDVLTDTGTIRTEWSALFGGTGNDEFNLYGVNTIGAHGGTGDDMFYFWSNGTNYVDGGAGVDTYFASFGMFRATSGFVQISDFELGVDKLSAQSLGGDPGFTYLIEDWGPNTGVIFREISSGLEATVMLLGVAASDFDPGRDFVLL